VIAASEGLKTKLSTGRAGSNEVASPDRKLPAWARKLYRMNIKLCDGNSWLKLSLAGGVKI
jgi:hypothetical protein